MSGLADHDSPDVRGLWAAVLERPACDTARLVLADCLDEVGDPDRAAYIRAAVELAGLDPCDAYRRPDSHERNPGQCDYCAAQEDCDRLLRAHEADWRKAGECPACGGDSGLHVRVMNTDTRTVRTHRITVCPACQGTGDRGGLLAMTVPENTGDPAVTSSEHRVDWQRGFPAAVHAPLQDVFVRVGRANNAGGWVPTPRALAWVREWPVIQKVYLTCRRPLLTLSGQHRWFFGDWSVPPVASEVPESLYLEACKGGGGTSDCRSWDSEAEAVDALALAVARVLRAALKPVPA